MIRNRAMPTRSWLTALVGIVALAGCAAPTAVPSRETASDRPGAIARLEKLAESSPTGPADTPPPPDPSLEPLTSADAEWSRANEPFDRVLPTWPVTIESVESDIPEPAATERALRLYAEARQLTDPELSSRAIRLLEEAAGLDPGAPEIWRALGDARRAAGFESTSGAAYTRAADLGLAEPEALTLAGLHALRREERDRAAGYLVRALRAEFAHADPLVQDVAMAHLGEVLLDLGWTRAGCHALEKGLSFTPFLRMPTNMSAQAGAIQRRRGDLLRRLGDGWCRLGEFHRAASAYALSAESPTGATPEIRARRMYALRRAGRTAEAALLLLEDLETGAIFDSASFETIAEIAARLTPRTLLADAIAEIQHDGSGLRRVNLILARAAALPAVQGNRLLESSISDRSIAATTATRRLLLDARLARQQADDPGRIITLADRIIASDPGLARMVITSLAVTDREPATLNARISRGVADQDRRAAMLAEFALLIDDHDLIETALELPTRPTAENLAREAALAASAGRWDRADRAIERLTALADAAGEGHRIDTDRQLLRSLESSQRFDEALRVARAVADSPQAGVDDHMRRSALAHLAGNTDEARRALEKALETDPADERVYKAILAFHGTAGPIPDNERSAEIGRMLREQAPSGVLLRQIVVSEMLRRGLVNEAGERLAQLFDENATDEETLESMLIFWRRLIVTDRAAQIDLEHVHAAIEQHPASTGLVRLLAGGLVLLGRPEEALEAVEAHQARVGSPVLAVLKEQIIRDALKDPERADRLTEQRLERTPRPIAAAIESASFLAARLDADTPGTDRLEAILGSLRDIPDRSKLTEVQRNEISTTISRVAAFTNARRDSANPDDPGVASLATTTLECLDWADRRDVPMAPATHDLRLTLLTENRAESRLIARAFDRAAAAYPVSTQAFARRVADLLTAASREDDAFEWISSASFPTGDDIRDDVFPEWFRLVILTASRDRGREMIDALISRDRVLEGWTIMRPEDSELAERDGTSPAELGYLLAQYAGASADRDAVAEFLRLALEYDPHHPWACNDLGYTMLVEDGPLDEAERLIEIAYEALPDRPNIIDSLGWVRYHTGRLEDETDPTTGEVRPGAVNLLWRAAALLGSEDDGIVHDHLGDALYAAGRTEDAIEAWRRAATQANQALSRLKAEGRIGGIRFRELQTLATSAAMKRNAIQLGEAPAVEPQRGLLPKPNDSETKEP